MSKQKMVNKVQKSRKNGRPPKVSFEEKKAIVDSFFAVHTNAAHISGIYTRIAEYAQKNKYDLQAYDFSKDGQIRQHIAQKIANSQKPMTSNLIPVYEPLDVDYAVTLRGNRLATLLRQREEYYAQLYNQAVAALEDHSAMAREINNLKAQLDSARALEKEQNEFKQMLSKCMEENTQLRQKIRNEIEPAKADDYFKSLSNPSVAINMVRDTLQTNIQKIDTTASIVPREKRIDFTNIFLKGSKNDEE